METLIHLMRHGEVDNPARIRYGRLPGYRLSPRGRAQARQAAAYLRRGARAITTIVSSPLQRAVETATIVQEALALPPIATDERLIEAVSVFDGLDKLAFLSPRHWSKLWNPLVPSWGEPFRSVAARMHAILRELRVAHAGAAIVLVSHQSPIWIARHTLTSTTPPWTSRVRCTQASLTTLRFDGERYLGHRYWAPPRW